MLIQSGLDLVLSCDSSGFKVGAMLSHRMPDGSERPISFASSSLSAAERYYSPLDREACAVMFRVLNSIVTCSATSSAL